MKHNRKISVIGLGYVGLTLAAAFSHDSHVIAYDNDSHRVKELKQGYDRNKEITLDEMNLENISFTSHEDSLKNADFYCVTLPTLIDIHKKPSLDILMEASKVLGTKLKKGDIVVYESTVYPGVTEEILVPILEKSSKLTYKKDFTVGYSPERINPSDKYHHFFNINKVISATDDATLDIIASVYESVMHAKVHRVSSIRIAEATKIIENSQRDVNIAFMNDITMMLHALGLNTSEVIAAMKTKWNFISFQPGLVGGHCVGVNSYYLQYVAEKAGYHSDIISSSRQVNEFVPQFIVNETVKKFQSLHKDIKHARIAVLGITYKEDCSDVRDACVIDIINQLKTLGFEVLVHDPIANKEAAKKNYDITLSELSDITNVDALLFAVKHKQYVGLSKKKILKMLKIDGLIMDVKQMIDQKKLTDTQIIYWRL